MKKTAFILFLIGGTLLALHFFEKDVEFIAAQDRRLPKLDKKYGWYVRGSFMAVGIVLWMSARTAE